MHHKIPLLKLVIFLILNTIALYLNAQTIQFPDLVVTEKGDSVRCKIHTVNIRSNTIHIEKPDSIKGIAKAVYSVFKVKYYTSNYYKTLYWAPAGYPVNKQGQLTRRQGLEACYAQIGWGPSRMNGPIAASTDNVRKNLQKLRSGTVLTIGIGAFFFKYLGIQAQIENFYSKAYQANGDGEEILQLGVQAGPAVRLPFGGRAQHYVYGMAGAGIVSGNSTPKYHGYIQGVNKVTQTSGFAALGVRVQPWSGLGFFCQVSTASVFSKQKPIPITEKARASIASYRTTVAAGGCVMF